MTTTKTLKKEEITILMVEDSKTQAEKMRYLLETAGYKVWIAYSREEAMELLKNQIPHVIISDIIMPGMDGYELCLWVRSNKKLQRKPFIFLTSLSYTDDIIKGLECQADAFLWNRPQRPFCCGIKSWILTTSIRWVWRCSPQEHKKMTSWGRTSKTYSTKALPVFTPWLLSIPNCTDLKIFL